MSSKKSTKTEKPIKEDLISKDIATTAKSMVSQGFKVAGNVKSMQRSFTELSLNRGATKKNKQKDRMSMSDSEQATREKYAPTNKETNTKNFAESVGKPIAPVENHHVSNMKPREPKIWPRMRSPCRSCATTAATLAAIGCTTDSSNDPLADEKLAALKKEISLKRKYLKTLKQEHAKSVAAAEEANKKSDLMDLRLNDLKQDLQRALADIELPTGSVTSDNLKDSLAYLRQLKAAKPDDPIVKRATDLLKDFDFGKYDKEDD